MLKQTKGQGLSINAIILITLGLIVLLVVVIIFTGKTGLFSKGAEEAGSCGRACNALGMTKSISATEATCVDTATNWYQRVPGKFNDVTPTEVCCCYKQK